MTRRRLEIAVLAFAGLFVAVVVYHFRPGRRPGSGTPAEALPRVPAAREAGQPTTVLRGFDYSETLRGKPLFRIQSERTVGFGAAAGLLPNVYALERVSLTVYPEQGTAVTVHADRADYDRRTSEATLKGNVRWSDERGAVGQTEAVQFFPSSRLLVAAGAIHLSRGTFTLEARSGRYDVGRRELRLDGPVRGSGTGEGSGGLSSLAADTAVYRRDEGSVELSGSVSGGSRSGESIACDRLLLGLAAEGERLEWAKAEGRVRGSLSSAHLPPAQASSRPRTYAGDGAALLFGSDGEARSLSLTGAPATVEEPGRTVRADTIEVSLRSGRPASARAQGSVRIDGENGRGQADRAALAFSESGEVESLELEGNVTMKGEQRSALSEKAVELPSRGVWVLTGGNTRSASVESSGSRVSAARIEFDQRRKSVRAEGDARAVFIPDAAKEGTPTLVGDASRPTYGKAERMVFDDASRLSVLSGRASLWQGASSLFGDDITLNDLERTVVAVGNTRAVFATVDSGVRPADRAPAVVTARRVLYREASSTALFEGGVRVVRGSWRATAERAAALIGKDRKLERVEMSGDVTLADLATGRTGKADRAVDSPAEEKTVLEGSPAWVLDGEGNRVSGAILSIAGRGKSVEVTAPAGGRTETIHRTRVRPGV